MSHTTQARSQRRSRQPIGRTAVSVGHATRDRRSIERQARNWIEIAVLIVIVVLLIVGAVTTSQQRNVMPKLAMVKVQSGDTLWTLAKNHPVKGLSTQQVVGMLTEVNSLSGPVVTPGESILLPTGTLDQCVATR